MVLGKGRRDVTRRAVGYKWCLPMRNKNPETLKNSEKAYSDDQTDSRLMTDGGEDMPDDIGMSDGGDDSDSSSEGSNDEDDPVAQLQDVFADAQDDVTDASSGGDAMRIAMDAAEDMAAIEVEADAGGSQQVHQMARAFLNDIADVKGSLSRKPVRGVWKDEIEQLEKEQKVQSGEAVIFNDLLQRELNGVVKKVSTDLSSTEETEYVLQFRDGTGLTVTQTTLTEERALWKAYTAAQEGEYPERYGSAESEWDNFIGGLIGDLETVEREVGPRTAALRTLENYVSNATAYGNVTDAVEQGGVYVDAEPDAHSEVQVPREAIASITANHEITDRALQAELSARGVSGPSLPGSKVSDSTSVNGRWQTFWYLDGDHFTNVGSYEEEATDPIDRMDDVAPVHEAESNDDSECTSEDSDDGDGDGDDDGEPGRIGASGGDNGGDTQ